MVMLFDKSGSKLHTIEVIRANISQELNGEYRCSIEVPAWVEIEAEQIVELLDADGTVQKFRLTQPIRGIETTRADGWHITQDLANDLILNRAWLTRTAAQAWPELLQAGISERRFTGTSDIATVAPLRIVRMSVLQAAIGGQDNSFINRFGGELERNNFTVNLKSRLGADRGFRVSFARNMRSVSIDEDSADIVNRIVPTFLNASNAAVALPETYIDSALIGNTATPHVKHVHYSDIKVLAEDLDGNIAYPTIESAQAEVRARVAKLYADGIDQPRLTVDVDFLMMRDINEQIDSPLETVLLGDTVQVVLGLDSYTERLVSYTWDCLTKEYTRTILGQPYRSVGSMVAQIEAATEAATDEKIENELIPSLTQARLDLINAAAQASGYFTTTVLNPDGSARIYFHDDPVLADSTKIEYYPEPGTKVYTNAGWNSGNPVWQYGTTDGDLVVGTLTAQVIQVQNEFDAIEIGGRNLLRDSGTVRTTTRFISVDTYEDLAEYIGENVVVSFDLRIETDGVLRGITCAYAYQEHGISVASDGGLVCTPGQPGTWQRFSVYTQVKDWGIVNPAYTTGAIAFYDSSGENHYSIRNIKIEKGNKSTDWTPAPEDMATKAGLAQTNYTTINGGNIVTGLIKSGNGYSQINLDDGSFNFANGGFTYNPISGAILAGWEVTPTKLIKEAAGTGGSYAKADYWAVDEYILGLRTFTPSEFAFYDVNGDNRISISDSTNIEYMFLFGTPNPDVLNYKLVLDPANGNSFILAQAIWPATGEVIRETKIGSGSVETSLVETRTVMANRVCADEFRVGKDGGNTYGVTQTFTTIEGKDVTATKGIVTDVSNTAKTKLTVGLPITDATTNNPYLYKSATTTINTFSNGWEGSITLSRYGDLVSIKGILSKTGTVTNGTILTTVPVDFRPHTTTPIAVAKGNISPFNSSFLFWLVNPGDLVVRTSDTIPANTSSASLVINQIYSA